MREISEVVRSCLFLPARVARALYRREGRRPRASLCIFFHDVALVIFNVEVVVLVSNGMLGGLFCCNGDAFCRVVDDERWFDDFRR